MAELTPTTSVLYPLQPGRLADVIPFADLLQQRGTGRLWLGQSLGVQTHQVFAAIAGAGIRIPCGTSVVLTPLVHPYEAALDARSVAALSGMPFVAGIGPGSTSFQSSMRPSAYARPAASSARYLDAMRDLLTKGRTEVDDVPNGIVIDATLPKMDLPQVELGLGVLRSGMARAAGRSADVAITWMTPPHYVRDSLVPVLREAAESVGRTQPRVATVVHVALERPGYDVVELAHTAAVGHLSSEHYCDMLRRAGLAADPGDSRLGARSIVDSGTFVTGSPAAVADALQRYHDAGVGEVILNTAGVVETYGPGAAMADLYAILDEIDGRAHA